MLVAVVAVVAVSALPVVSWFSVATRAAATVPEEILEPLIAVILAPLPYELIVQLLKVQFWERINLF